MSSVKLTFGIILFVLCIAGIIAVPILLVKSCNKVVKEVTKEVNDKEALLGKKIVISKDTLIIQNYSSFGDNYTLSNGTKADADFVNKNYLH